MVAANPSQITSRSQLVAGLLKSDILRSIFTRLFYYLLLLWTVSISWHSPKGKISFFFFSILFCVFGLRQQIHHSSFLLSMHLCLMGHSLKLHLRQPERESRFYIYGEYNSTIADFLHVKVWRISLSCKKKISWSLPQDVQLFPHLFKNYLFFNGFESGCYNIIYYLKAAVPLNISSRSPLISK